MTRDVSWPRVGVWAALAVAAVALPQVLTATSVNRAGEIIYIAVAALALALLTGYNGQISLGHGAFLGLGAYVTIIGTVDYGLSYPVAGLLAVLAAFLLGLIVGLPALRITGIYLALVTLALATLFPQIVVRLGDITGSTVGRGLVPRDGYGDSEQLQEVGRRRFLSTGGGSAPRTGPAWRTTSGATTSSSSSRSSCSCSCATWSTPASAGAWSPSGTTRPPPRSPGSRRPPTRS